MANKITQYIYLIHTREFYNHDELVYKIGKTKKLNFHRFNQYPRGSVLLFQMVCNDCDICETKILKHFNSRYKHRKDVGTEYFEGDYNDMIDEIFKIVKNNVDVKAQKKIKTNNVKESKQPIVVENKYNEIKKNIINITNRTCPKCCRTFKYPNILKAHLTKSFHCLSKDDEIINILNKTVQLVKPTISTIPSQPNQCIKCNKSFNNKKALDRHKRETKCCKPQCITTNQLHLEQQSNANISPTLNNENIPIKLATLISTVLTIEQQEEISQTILQHDINSNIIINPLINNNIIQNVDNNILNKNVIIYDDITHIIPFGFERLPNISQNRIKELLLLGDEGVIEIVKLVCEQDENKNFFKQNMNKTNISYINKEYKVIIYQEIELKEKLIKHCVNLMYQMFINCHNILTTNDIDYITSYIRNIYKKMSANVYDNGIKNIIENELRTNSKITKSKITEYINIINSSPEIKRKTINNFIEIENIKKTNDIALAQFLL